jgi:hypothetical protein
MLSWSLTIYGVISVFHAISKTQTRLTAISVVNSASEIPKEDTPSNFALDIESWMSDLCLGFMSSK